jgi:DNA mismatch repair protein MutL
VCPRARRIDPSGLVRDVIELIEERGVPPTSEKVLEEVLHRTACRSSVMAGDALSEAEMRALLAQGADIESDQTCVHARPTRVRFTLADLEKAFHRR